MCDWRKKDPLWPLFRAFWHENESARFSWLKRTIQIFMNMPYTRTHSITAEIALFRYNFETPLLNQNILEPWLFEFSRPSHQKDSTLKQPLQLTLFSGELMLEFPQMGRRDSSALLLCWHISPGECIILCSPHLLHDTVSTPLLRGN